MTPRLAIPPSTALLAARLRRSGSRALRAGMPVVAALLLASRGCLAGCIPLPTPELRQLDRDTNADPVRAIAQASRRLADGSLTPQIRAELHSIIASAAVEASRPDEVEAHVRAGLDALAGVAPGDARHALTARLHGARGDALGSTGDFAGAARALDQAMSASSPGSLEHACILGVRSQLHSATNELDKATSDGLEAYQLAQQNGWADARAQAAYSLAAVYGVAGLTSQALPMIDEVVEFAGREQRFQLLESSQFMRTRLLITQRRFADALASSRQARTIAERIGDRVGVAAADLNACATLIELNDLARAQANCHSGAADLERAHRVDLLSELRVQQARLVLLNGRPAQALALLDAAMGRWGPPPHSGVAALHLQYRASAHAALGQMAAAYADIAEALEVSTRNTARERVQAALVLGAMNERSRLIAAQHALEARMAAQTQEIAAERRVRQMSVAFSLGAILLVALLVYFLRKSARQGAQLRRNAATLGAVVRHAPDALVLLDAARVVQYSNRNLFGGEAAHAPGTRLLDEVPAPVLPPLLHALDAIYDRRDPVTVRVHTGDAGGVARDYEVLGAPVVEDGRVLGAVLRSVDATTLRRLEREVVDASSRERLRLSGDLHEGLGQQLSGIAMLARSLLADFDKGRSVSRQTLQEITAHLATSVDLVREIARGLSPVAIERGSLGDALSRLVAEWRAPPAMRLDAGGIARDLDLSDEAADHLYRIAQEALINATRHSGAGQVRVGLERRDERLELCIDDDGSGFVVRGNPDGLGLRMIEYRSHLLGGTLSIDSAAGRGTQIRVSVPWERCRRA